MSENNKYTHTFYDLKVTYAGAGYIISGKAVYEIFNGGIGYFEYWGSRETNDQWYAEFESVEFDHCKMEEQTEYQFHILMWTDIEALQNLVLEKLNEDFSLCAELADNIKHNEIHEE